MHISLYIISDVFSLECYRKTVAESVETKGHVFSCSTKAGLSKEENSKYQA